MASVIALAGQVSVTSAGKAVRFTSTKPGTFLISAKPQNSGNYVYVGNDGSTTGDVTSSNGYVLSKSLMNSIVVTVNNLNQLWLDATTTGDGACWMKIVNEAGAISPPVA